MEREDNLGSDHVEVGRRILQGSYSPQSGPVSDMGVPIKFFMVVCIIVSVFVTCKSQVL